MDSTTSTKHLGAGSAGQECDSAASADSKLPRGAVSVTVSDEDGAWHAEGVRLDEHPALKSGLEQLSRQGALISHDTEKTRGARAPPAAVQSPAAAERQELNLVELSETYPDECAKDKEALLQSQEPVRALCNVCCRKDPDWTLAMVRKHAPALEELWLFEARREHLLTALTMPHLRRLRIWRTLRDLTESPELPVPARWEELRSLRVGYVPRRTLEDLLAACSHTLRELVLRIGTPGRGREKDHWPDVCSDLHVILGGLKRLQSLTLWRPTYTHAPSDCTEQLSALRRALPHCAVIQCGWCGQGGDMEAEIT